MKKITTKKIKLILFLAVTSFLLLNGCASSKKADNSAVTAETSENNETSAESKKSDKKTKKEKKSKKNNADNKSEEKTDSSAKKNNRRPVIKDSGIIRLRAIPSMGSFNFCVINEKGKAIPVLSSSNEYASTSFYLSTDKKNYRLTAGSGVESSAVNTDNGMCLDYKINKVADVQINFDCFASEEGRENDMLKVTATVTNLSSKKGKFALKAVLDSVLGESYRNHFYTSDGLSVKNERLFSSSVEEPDMEKWILSKNSNAGMQLFLRGNDTTRMEQVQLANYSTLDTQNWYPNLTDYRAFDTVTSYNNSAIGINWPYFSLQPEENKVIVFYIAFSANEIDPNGVAFMNLSEKSYISEEKADSEKNTSDSTNYVENSVDSSSSSKNVKNNNVPENNKKSNQEKKPVPEVKFDTATLTAEQLEPEYIQNLINRITVLEESGLAVNRAELLQLNAELDAILEILRKN